MKDGTFIKPLEEREEGQMLEPFFVPPVEGTMGGGFNDKRSHGKHLAGDIYAAPGSTIVAPVDMEFLYGGKGGTNLRDNDFWAHFRDIETGKEYRFAHHDDPRGIEPGTIFKQGEPWSTVGNAISKPHLHMSVVGKEEHEDWPSLMGWNRGQEIGVKKAESKAEVTAGSVTGDGSFLGPLEEIAPEIDKTTEQSEIDMLDNIPEAKYVNEVGAAVGDVLAAPRTYLTEPTVGKAYDKLLPLINPNVNLEQERKGFVIQPTSYESMLRPGEFGQVGGEETPGTVNMLTMTPREMLLGAADAKVVGLANRANQIRKAYTAGQRVLPQVLSPKGKALGPISPLSVVDDPAHGPIAYQGTLKLAEDTPFGAKGEKVGTFPFRQEHLDLRLAAEKVDFSAPKLETIETTEAMLDRINDALPGAKKIFWEEGKRAENIAHRRTLLLQDEVADWGKKLDTAQSKNAGAWAIAQRKGGPERLTASNVPIPASLSESETALVSWSRERFDDWFEQVNKARLLAGKQPFPYSEDYITFMRRFEELGKNINPLFVDYTYFKPFEHGGLKFPWEKAPKKAGPIETDLLKIVNNYGQTAERYIATAPQVGKIRQFTNEWKLANGTKIEALAEKSPSLDSALQRYADQIAGVPPADRILGRWAADQFYKLSNRFALYTMTFNPRTWTNQIGAIVGAAGETSFPMMVQSIKELGQNPKLWFEYRKASQMLAQRRMDVSMADFEKGLYGSALGKAQHIGMYPTEIVDDFFATAAFGAGLKKAKQLGLKGEDARRFADAIVPRTQGDPSVFSRSPIQSTKLGKGMTTFGTFAIADANYVARHILGINNPNWTQKEMWRKLAHATLAGVSLVGLSRAFGVRAPVPDFFKMWDAYEAGETPTKIATTGLQELVSRAPVVGGLAMGQVPGGPVVSSALDLVSERKSPLEIGFSFTGAPAGGVISKLLKSEPGVNLRGKLEDVTGLPIGPRGEFKDPLKTPFESIMGVDRLLTGAKTLNRADELLYNLRDKLRKGIGK